MIRSFYKSYTTEYVQLNKMLKKEIELRACSFFRMQNGNNKTT